VPERLRIHSLSVFISATTLNVIEHSRRHLRAGALFERCEVDWEPGYYTAQAGNVDCVLVVAVVSHDRTP
jgi:hypothetical protein